MRPWLVGDEETVGGRSGEGVVERTPVVVGWAQHGGPAPARRLALAFCQP